MMKMPNSDFRGAARIAGRGALLAALLLSAASCTWFESAPEEQKETQAKEEDRFTFLRKKEQAPPVKAPRETPDQEKVSPTAAKESPVPDEVLKKFEKGGDRAKTVAPRPVETKIGGPQKVAPGVTVTPSRFYDDFIALNGDEEIPVSLIFNNAPLLDVLSAFADILGFNFVADSDLRSMVTLNVNSKMSRRELWNTFDRMLFVANAGVRVEDTLLRIVPRSRLVAQPDSKMSNSILFFPLTGASAREAMLQIRPLLAPGGVAIELSRPNALLVCDTSENIPKLREILDYINRAAKTNWPVAVIPCRNVLPNKVVTELQEILPVLGFTVVRPNDRGVVPGGIQLIGLDRIQTVIATAATKEAIQEIREWVKLLDTSSDSDLEQVFVYKVRHNKAAHLVRALSVIFDVQGSSLSVDTNTGNTRIETINPPRAQSNATSRTTAAGIANRSAPSAVANTASAMLTHRDSDIFSKPTRIFADGVLNRLIIRTNPRTYASIKALLDRLDVVPAQVLLQILVIEVTLNESTQFGLEFSGAETGNSLMSLFGTNYAGGNTNLNPFIVNPIYDGNNQIGTTKDFAVGSDRQNGATVVLADPNDPQKRFGYIRALAGNGLVKIISNPQILVSSNTEALVQVGANVPLLSQSYTNTSSAGSSQNSYRYEETGIILKVTPQITSTDLIAMEVRQELSQAVKNTSSSIDSPAITKRIVDTTMTIANGQTMVIGGLIQEVKNDKLDSLPILNKIPIINRLVGSTDANVERSEILVMVTGTIVDEHSPVEEMIKRYNNAIKAVNDFDSKLGDRPDADKSNPELMTSMEFWVPGAVK